MTFKEFFLGKQIELIESAEVSENLKYHLE
jgi:hypothetical protein